VLAIRIELWRLAAMFAPKPIKGDDGLLRCGWCAAKDFYVAYHDHEWGVPERHNRTLFEFLVLEGAQAGLSWETILRKRAAYRKAFAGFDPAKVARFGKRDIRRLLGDAGIVRNRLKIESAVSNARAFLEVTEKEGSFAKWIWRFVDGTPIQNRWTSLKQVPARTELSDQISKELKLRGFSFVGTTIVYAHMQATGMVNDHLTGCFRHSQVAKLAKG
jgi:DNA-3-methyladenine glycosylase I